MSSKPTPILSTPPPETETLVAEYVLPLTFERDTKTYRVLATGLGPDAGRLIVSRDGAIYLAKEMVASLPTAHEIMIQIVVR